MRIFSCPQIYQKKAKKKENKYYDKQGTQYYHEVF